MADNFYANYPVPNSGMTGVSSLNSLEGAVNLVGGTGITVTPAGSNITIAASGSSGANQTLSNLTSPTAVNQNLTFNTANTFGVYTLSLENDLIGYFFTIFGGPYTVTPGDVYSNNGHTFIVTNPSYTNTINAGFALMTGTSGNPPSASGTLTRVTGTGAASITFSSFTNNGIQQSSLALVGLNQSVTGLDGGNVTITGGSASDSTRSGGNINLTSGAADNSGSITLLTPSCVNTPGTINIEAGDSTGTTSNTGNMNITAGSLENAANTQGAGSVNISAGGTNNNAGTGGNVNIAAGTAGDGTSPTSGSVVINDGNFVSEVSVTPDRVSISSGGEEVLQVNQNATTLAADMIITGNYNSSPAGGTSQFIGSNTDSANAQSQGQIAFGSTDTTNVSNFTPYVFLVTGSILGSASAQSPGGVEIVAGSVKTGVSNTGSAAGILLNGGSADSGHGGTINLNSGNSVSGTAGDINLSAGAGTGGTKGIVTIDALYMGCPRAAADPTGSSGGQVYYNTVANKLKVFNGATWETITSV